MRTAASVVLFVSLAACAAMPDRPATMSPSSGKPTVTVSRGPCFGFCPVYTVSVGPEGRIDFDGERHTAVLGKRTRAAPAGAYDRLTRDLAAFRVPAGETRAVPCERQVSDQPTYTVTWASSGVAPATLTFDMGCASGSSDSLKATLNALPSNLGIGDWAAQVTRPGATRG